MKQIGYGRMHGVPLIATSPVRNDESPINLHGFDVTSFQPPWKMISDLAMHADSKNNGMHQMHSPAYQDIVNQVRHWSKSGFSLSFLGWLINLNALHNFAWSLKLSVSYAPDFVLLSLQRTPPDASSIDSLHGSYE